MLKLTSAYSAFVNGGKLVSPILIDRVQDSEGNTILNNENRSCLNCDKLSYTGKDFPNVGNNFKQVFSPQTAYQITSLLEGVVKRGTGKKLRDLNLNLAGKTGTTNKNTDASVFLLVVPVLPARFKFKSLSFFPVPLFTTPSSKEVIW